MIFDDSLEYDGFFPANGAELISMKKWHDIKLSEIWIPSELLPNRDVPLRLNSDKPVLYQTLERPKPVDSLSVYSELDIATKENNSEKLLDSLEDLSYDKRWAECEASILINEDCQSSFNKEYNSNDHEVFKSGDNSFADLLEHLCLSDSDAEDLAVETKPLFDPLLKDSVMHLENNLNQELGNTNDKSVGSPKNINKSYEFIDKSDVLHNNNSSEKDFSKESAFNYNNFSKIAVNGCEVIDVNCKLNEIVNSDINNLGDDKSTLENVSKDYTNSNVLLQKHETSLSIASTSNKSILQSPNVDNILKADSTHDTVLFDPMFLCQNPVDDIWCESANREASFDCKHTEGGKLTFTTENENTSFQNEQIISHPVLYTISKKEEFVSDVVRTKKGKAKKDKKPKKKTMKNIDLNNFFLSESETKRKQPDVPDYLNYLMQKEFGTAPPVKSNCDLPSENTVFPPLSVRSDAEYGELFGEIEDEIENEKMSLKLITNLLKESSHPPTTYETVSADSLEKRNEIKIVIENIPLGVDNETMESILLSYGTINRLNLRRHGIFLKADIWMCLHSHIEDPEWIIECLNGSQPFGVSSSGQELKCYLKK